jgi:hypothetical protein
VKKSIVSTYRDIIEISKEDFSSFRLAGFFFFTMQGLFFDVREVALLSKQLQSIFEVDGWKGLMEEEKRIINEIKIN